MKQLKLTLLFLIFAAVPLLAQEEFDESEKPDTVIVHTSLKPFVFTYRYAIDSTETNYKGEYERKWIINISTINSDSILSSIYNDEDWDNYIEFQDLNCDGYLDFSIQTHLVNLIAGYDFYIFLPDKNNFEYSEEYAQLYSFEIDCENKTVYSYAQSTGGKGGYTETYRIVDGHLQLYETEGSDYFDYGRSILINGKMTQVKRYDGSFNPDTWEATIEYHSYVEDSLRLVKIIWKKGFDGDPTKEQEDNYVVEYVPWGGWFINIKKEDYSYTRNEKGKVIQTVKKYQVIKNKWIEVKEFTE